MSRELQNLNDETDIVIRCGSKSQADAMLSYIDGCELDFIHECKVDGIKIRYFDVEYESNIIVID